MSYLARKITLMLATLLILTLVNADTLDSQQLSPLPMASSNNAIAAFQDETGLHFVSLLGLGEKKSAAAIHNSGFISNPLGQWQKIKVPGQPRLAAVAVAIGSAVYLLGGYTVAADGSELSTAEVYRYQNTHWETLKPMPIPVDDMVALVYLNRYIYLISGWHDVGNVNLVQILDTKTGEWIQATPWPGKPVFGHAGAIFENHLVICDGVRIQYHELNIETESSRTFVSSAECWLGEINKNDVRRINWRQLPPHPGAARYRMVAAANESGLIVFAGGSTNPYNFNGIGYNQLPSTAVADVFAFDLKAQQWQQLGSLSEASMDHRGMIYQKNWFYLIGGMTNPQTVTARVLRFKLD